MHKISLLYTVLLLALAAGCGDAAPPRKAGAQKVLELYREHEKSFDAPVISVQSLLNIPTNQLLLVDVRTPEERQVSMIPGAWSREAFDQALEDAGGRVVVAYCTVGARSGKYAEELRRKHDLEAFNLQGGILAWIQEGLPLVNATGITKAVHVYGKPWDVVPEDYQSSW